MSDMLMERDNLMKDLHSLVSTAKDRVATLQDIAELLRSSGSYRWVGLYDVDHAARVVKNIVWSGPSAPEYPMFPITTGLTGAVISPIPSPALKTLRFRPAGVRFRFFLVGWLTAAALLLLATPAFADLASDKAAVVAAKAAGTVGEQADGYLGLVSGSADAVDRCGTKDVFSVPGDPAGNDRHRAHVPIR